MTGPAPEPAAETWTYGGVRTRDDGKRRHAWLDPEGRERLFKPGAATAGHPAVGSTTPPG
jgi:hypothetical protein